MRLVSATILVLLAAGLALSAYTLSKTGTMWLWLYAGLAIVFFAIAMKLTLEPLSALNVALAATLLTIGVGAFYFMLVDGCLDDGGMLEGGRCVGGRSTPEGGPPSLLAVAFWIGCLAFAVRTLVSGSNVLMRRVLAIVAAVGMLTPIGFVANETRTIWASTDVHIGD